MNNERPPPSPKPPRKYPDLHDRMEALAILAEIRLSRIEKQQAEIERLRGLVYCVPPSEPFAPDGITWKQEAERLRDLLADEQELRLGPKPLSKKDYFENLLQHGVVL